MTREETNEKAKRHIANAGFGTGTNVTIHALKCMMVDFYLDNQVKESNPSPPLSMRDLYGELRELGLSPDNCDKIIEWSKTL